METGTVCQRRTIIARVARVGRCEADGPVLVRGVIPPGTGFHPNLRIGLVAKPLVGQFGRYLQVLNSASEKGL